MSHPQASFSVLVAAFGTNGTVPATVTRPAPDNTPIAVTAIWVEALTEERPYGTDLQVREPRRVLVLPRPTVPTLPRGTAITAPEIRGGATKTWRVDGLQERAGEPDCWRAIVVIAA